MYIWKKYQTVLLIPWNDVNYKETLLKKNSTIPGNKSGTKKYLSFCFIRQYSKVYPKFQLTHNIPIKKILDSNLVNQLKQQEESMTKHKIQENREEIAGFIIGSIPDCINIDNLEEELKVNNEMKDMNIIIKLEYIPLQNKKRLSFENRKKSVWYTQLYTGFSNIPLCHKKLNAIWGSQNIIGCPLGLTGFLIFKDSKL